MSLQYIKTETFRKGSFNTIASASVVATVAVAAATTTAMEAVPAAARAAVAAAAAGAAAWQRWQWPLSKGFIHAVNKHPWEEVRKRLIHEVNSDPAGWWGM